MDDLIGIDGRPLQLCGLALPFQERAGDNLPIASNAMDLSAGVPIVWEHESDREICGAHRVELLGTTKFLFFAATLPDVAAGRHVANLASSGQLRVSVETNAFAQRIENAVITKTSLLHIGLTRTPAHSSTICWRSDFAPDALTPEQRTTRSCFVIADMDARVKLHQPPPRFETEVIAFAKNMARDLNARAKLRKKA